jgi:hypothetical protein
VRTFSGWYSTLILSFAALRSIQFSLLLLINTSDTYVRPRSECRTFWGVEDCHRERRKRHVLTLPRKPTCTHRSTFTRFLSSPLLSFCGTASVALSPLGFLPSQMIDVKHNETGQIRSLSRSLLPPTSYVGKSSNSYDNDWKTTRHTIVCFHDARKRRSVPISRPPSVAKQVEGKQSA